MCILQLLCHTIIHYTNLHIVFDNVIIVSDDVIVDTEFFEVSYNNYGASCIYHNNNNLQMSEKL